MPVGTPLVVIGNPARTWPRPPAACRPACNHALGEPDACSETSTDGCSGCARQAGAAAGGAARVRRGSSSCAQRAPLSTRGWPSPSCSGTRSCSKGRRNCAASTSRAWRSSTPGTQPSLLDLKETALRLYPDMSEKRIDRRLQNPLSVASLLVAADRAGGMVAGSHAHHPGGHRGGGRLHPAAGGSGEAHEHVPHAHPGLRRPRGGDARVRRLRGGHRSGRR